MKKTLLVALALSALLASSAMAASYEGHWGFSVLNSSQPVGLSFGMGKANVLGIGVGFAHESITVSRAATSVSSTDWSAILSLDHACHMDDENNITIGGEIDYSKGSSSTFRTLDTSSPKEFGVGVRIGAEHWFGKLVSVHLHHGVRFAKVSNGGPSAFGTTGDVLGNAGFTVWFK